MRFIRINESSICFSSISVYILTKLPLKKYTCEMLVLNAPAKNLAENDISELIAVQIKIFNYFKVH